MSAALRGARWWEMDRDDEGHRTYKLCWEVQCSDKFDGPAVVFHTPGMPLPGSLWNFGNDVDLWAWCRPTQSAKQMVKNEPNFWWEVEQTFSTKPPTHNKNRCINNEIQDPLQEPFKISGGYTKFKKEAVLDMNGFAIVNSAFEQIRGPENEWDENHPTVKIEQNVPALQYPLLCSMVDTVNVAPLWGFMPRMIKLSNISWERKFYKTCYLYYSRSLEFEVDYNTWDRNVLDEGTKALSGHWGRGPDEPPPNTGQTGWILDKIGGQNPNPSNPAHFIRFVDRKGNPSKVVLNGAGIPSGGATGTANNEGKIFIQKYPNADFSQLALPSTLDTPGR